MGLLIVCAHANLLALRAVAGENVALTARTVLMLVHKNLLIVLLLNIFLLHFLKEFLVEVEVFLRDNHLRFLFNRHPLALTLHELFEIYSLGWIEFLHWLE